MKIIYLLETSCRESESFNICMSCKRLMCKMDGHRFEELVSHGAVQSGHGNARGRKHLTAKNSTRPTPIRYINTEPIVSFTRRVQFCYDVEARTSGKKAREGAGVY